MVERPIEKAFPIERLNKTAELEALSRHNYRPPLTIHKWWARRLGSVFRAICIYTLVHEDANMKLKENLDLWEILGREDAEVLKGDNLWPIFKGDVGIDVNATVLDPMMGGGTTVLEALLVGCDVIGCDLNPIAWFIVKKMIEPVDLDELERGYQDLEKFVAPEIKKYFRTSCSECDNEADVMYYFWVNELKCENCGQNVPLFGDWMLAKARSPKTNSYHVICPQCWSIFQTDNYKTEKSCPNCSYSFNPGEGNLRRGKRDYLCPRCGQTYEIIEAANRQGYSRRLFALEYYCPNCNLRDYKEAEEEDQELYDEARNRFEDEKENLPFPDQEKPYTFRHGPRKHGFTNFKDMFNKRQLLCLSKILNQIMEIEDEKIQEHLLLVFSETLAQSCVFCEYHRHRNEIEGLWSTRTLRVRHVFAENNVWGTKYGKGTFSKRFKMLKRAKEFLRSPFQKYVNESGKTIEQRLSNKIEGKLVNSFEELGEKGNSLLLCQSSDYLPIPDNAVDAIITDPPYYGNAIYSEHSDFYYVWLRLALKDRYDNFQAELTPRKKEAVVTPCGDEKFSIERKTEKDYISILRGIFEECWRVLKDEGLMVFTFHHIKSEAWNSVLKAVLNAGFYVTATYPIHSEMSTSTHIYEKQNIEYDTIVVCRKRKELEEEVPWAIIEDRIFTRTEEIAKIFKKEKSSRLSLPDLGVVTKGKCLEEFSRYYNKIIDEEGNVVEVHDAIRRTADIVDQLLVEERIQELSDKTADKLTALYLLFLAERDSITYDALHRQLKGRPTDPKDFTDHELLKLKGRSMRVVPPEERVQFIKELSPSRRRAIDKAHYLIYLLKDERTLTEKTGKWLRSGELGKWIDENVIFTLKELERITNDENYGNAASHAEKCLREIPQRKLEAFE